MESPFSPARATPILPGEGEERVLRLLESITDGFCAYDAEWRCTYMNEAARRILTPHRTDLEDIVGKNLWALFPELSGSLVHSQYLRAVQEGVAVEFEYHHPFWKRCFVIRAYPIRGGGLSVYFRDVTEQNIHSEAVRASEEKYRSLFDSIDEGFAVFEMIWDEHGEATDYYFKEVNPAFQVQTGLIGAEGRRVLEIQPNLEKHWFEIYGRVARTGEATRFVQGSEAMGRWFDVYAFPIGQGEKRLVAVLFTDVTARRRDEEALRQAKSDAEAGSRAKDDFLAALSHELRTPLTPVLMATEDLCEDPSLPPAIHQTLSMIRRNIALEARLIDDLLDLTRISTGKLALREQECEAHSLAALAVEIVRDDLHAKGQILEINLAAQRTHFRGDPARIQQVFWNLIRNAVKFTPAGGRITLRSHNEEGRLIIEVHDTGIGLATESLLRIFRPFDQAGRENDHRFGGLGLGLSIAKAIVEGHHGTIRAASEGLNCGSTFRIDLPSLERPLGVDGAGSQTEVAAGTIAAPPVPNLRLLVVEDHEATLAVLTRLLTRDGHQVQGAPTVAAALATATEHRFDAVISDIGLPDGTGIELMRELHEKYGLQGVALTGYGMEEDLRRTREAGFFTHLVKPVDFTQLRRVLAQVTRRPGAAQA